MEFSGAEYTLKNLVLMNMNASKDWFKQSIETRFEIIVIGIANCGVKESLTTLNLSKSKITVKRAKDILAKFGLTSISVSNE